VAKSRQLIASKYPAYFLARYVHRNEKGQSLDLRRCPALLAFLLDDARLKVAMKAVQAGISELLFVSCFAKTLKGWMILYSLPTIELKNTVVANRIDKSLLIVPFYRRLLKEASGDSDSRSLKHLAAGALKYVGSNSQTAFIEFAADMVVIDELDKSNQENVKLAPDRLDASPHKYLWKVGNPTFAKFGIHAEYLKSDQKQWHIRCCHCGEEQPLDWFKNVVEKTGEREYRLLDSEWMPRCGRDIKVLCRKCRGSLDRLSNGRWVAQNPGSEISGYHISQLFSPTKMIAEIYATFQAGLTDPTEMQRFFNSGLGLPYDAVGENVTAALLEAKCMRDYFMPSVAKGCTMGVDVGSKLNVRISDYPDPDNPKVRRAVFIGTVENFEDLDKLVLRYGVEFCTVDSRPEARKAREFQERFPDIVWLCDYATNEKLDFWTVDEDLQTIRVDRTEVIDGMMSTILTGQNWLPKDFKSLRGGEYVEQMEAPKRKLIIEHGSDGKPKKPRYVWSEGSQADHDFHADVYDYISSLLRDLIGKKECSIRWVNRNAIG